VIWLMWVPSLILVVLLLAAWSPWQQGDAGDQRAVDIARRRLASGEIGHEEFERLRQQLGVSRGRGGWSPGLLVALLIALLLVTLGSSIAWAWRSDDWGWGWGMGGDHMSRMMGGGGRDASTDPATRGGPAETVAIEDFEYRPGNLQIAAGSRVTWTNRDSAPHSATDSGRAWDTGVLARGKSATLTFSVPGTFDYYCTVHPSMRARITVQ
jgi:plastocyanin